MSAAISVVHIARLDLTFAPKPWAFAIERRAEIDAYFAALKRDKPALWNGRVLMLHDHRVIGDELHGAFLETDFASFLAWRNWGYPPSGIWDCFGAAAVMSADGAYLLGVMGAHTASSGLIYCPCGTPDLGDIFDGRIDFDHSVARELREETGLDVGAFTAEPGWTMVRTAVRIVLFKVVRASEGAEALRARVLDHLAREREPELAGVRMVAGPADLDPAMPDFVTAFLAQRWR